MSKAPEHITLRDLAGKVGISPDVARRLFDPPISRNVIYAMCERGEIEATRVGGNEDGVGGRILVLVVPLLRKFGALEALESSWEGCGSEPDSAAPIIRHA
jgi:hypothetical protein